MMQGVNNVKLEGLCVLPDFGVYSSMIMVLRLSFLHAQLQMCSIAQPASGEKIG